MNNELLITELQNRAGAYEFFSRILLSELDSATLDLFHSNSWSGEFQNLNVPIPENTDAVREALAVDYCKIFIGPKDFCPPYQSVWESGQMQGVLVASMSEFIDVVRPLTETSINDHAGLQFEMMSLILRYQSRHPDESYGLPGNFFQTHVAWTQRLLKKAIQTGETDFYREILGAAEQFIDSERQHYLVKEKTDV